MTRTQATKILKRAQLMHVTVYWGMMHTEADLIKAAKEAYEITEGQPYED